MPHDLEIHPIQAAILRVLLFRTEARFSDLNTDGVSSDHLTFHVKRLLEGGFVEKTAENLYRLTTKGKEFANRFDADAPRMVLEKQAKIGVLVGCVDGAGKTKKYLMQQRLKQPYYGFYGMITGKVKWGEAVVETAARELQEETGLTAKLALIGVEHKMDHSPDGQLLEDKYFFVFRATEPEGALLESFEGGRNEWLTNDEVRNLPDLFNDVEEIMTLLDQDSFLFLERKYTVEKY